MPAVIRADLDEWRDPAEVFQALYAGRDDVVWLDSGSEASSGRSVIGAAEPGSVRLTASIARGTVTRVGIGADGASTTIETAGDVFAALEAELARLTTPEADDAPGPGWYGWLGYELGAQTTGAPAHPARTPDAAWLLVRDAIVFDHARRRVSIAALDDGGHARAGGGMPRGERPAARIARLRAAIERMPTAASAALPPAHVPLAARPRVRVRHEPDAYARLIARAQAAIARGDAYQLCLTNELIVEADPDPVTVYLALRSLSPSHHGGLVRIGGVALLSSSPEQFLAIDRDRVVTTRPIKGTRPRARDPRRDDELARELLDSEKERAENLMIVDLMRNDLGRIARLGTVEVPALLELESYAQVHQLVSTVRAELAEGLGPIDAIRAAFPAGSMTGAPKRSAMTILHGLEAGPRGVYSGAFGRIGLDGTVDLAMVIRSIVLADGVASIGTGGGITALSIAEDEVEETRVKARALLEVLGARPV